MSTIIAFVVQENLQGTGVWKDKACDSSRKASLRTLDSYRANFTHAEFRLVTRRDTVEKD